MDAVEAHGTGTRLGDPIEAQALLATYGQGRDGGEPLWLGSIKSNLGHTQAAAGAAGIIKVVMALAAERLPRTLHVDQPSSHVDWASGSVELLTEAREWPRAERTRRAAVSSFGISGTNAHVIIEEAPESPAPTPDAAEEPPPVDLPAVPWVLSGRTPEALRGQAARLAAFLDERADGQDPPPADVGFSLATTRTALDHRAVVLGSDRDGLYESVVALANGGPSVVSGVVSEGRTGWMFTGQGSQRLGMGRELYAAFPVFAKTLDEVCGHLDAGLAGGPGFGVALREVLFAAEGSAEAALLDRTGYAQSALFAVQVSLVELLRSWGMGPDVVLGHSIGELAAAYAAGVFDLADAARLVAGRARLMQGLPSGGAMAAVEGTEAEVADILGGFAEGERATVAAVNGPTAVVVSGGEDVVERVMAVARERGRRVSRLRVSHAFHSPLMEPMLAEFAEVAAGVAYRQPVLPAVSTVTGALVGGQDWVTPEYWVDQVRRPVRFHDALLTASGEQGASWLLEVGPDPVLSALARAGAEPAVAVSTLRAGRAEAEAVLTAVAELYVRGAGVDWSGVFAGTGARRVELPTYAFQRERYWLDNPRPAIDTSGLGLGAAGHPMLGATVRLADSDTAVLQSRLSAATHPWLADHVVGSSIVVPGTAYVELAVQAGDQVGCDRVEELTLRSPMVVPRDGAVQVQIAIEPAEGEGPRTVRIHSRTEGAPADRPWTLNATGTLTADQPAADWDLRAWPPAGAEPMPVDGLYERLAGTGMAYGPVFRGLREVWRLGDDLFVTAALPEEAKADATGFGLHPALLDSVLHALGVDYPAPAPDEADSPGKALLPFLWSGVSLSAVGAPEVRAQLSVRAPGEVGLRVADTSGEPVAEVDALVLRPVSATDTAAAAPAVDSLFRLDWTPAPAPAADPGEPEAWTVLGDARPWQDAGIPVTGRADLAELVTALDGGADVPGTVLLPVTRAGGAGAEARVTEAVSGVLRVVREWLAEPRLATSRLAVLTSGAVVESDDLVGAGVWGLVRSAITENPGRFVLADTDGEQASYEALATSLTDLAEAG
ncbi:type I polyketide synthase, partial [Streptomyces himastatinicus]|uniref:type I polyketide synthase n=1 Tax=Streptomyces himastatinicus TaxID=998084 RepID=UPI003CCAE197